MLNFIWLWLIQTGICINTLQQHQYAVGALSWLPSGDSFVSGGMDSQVCFWVSQFLKGRLLLFLRPYAYSLSLAE